MMEDVGISVGLCFMILSENLSMWHVSAEFIPWIKRWGQWEPVAHLLQQAEVGKNFMKLIMGDWYVCL